MTTSSSTGSSSSVNNNNTNYSNDRFVPVTGRGSTFPQHQHHVNNVNNNNECQWSNNAITVIEWMRSPVINAWITTTTISTTMNNNNNVINTISTISMNNINGQNKYQQSSITMIVIINNNINTNVNNDNNNTGSVNRSYRGQIKWIDTGISLAFPVSQQYWPTGNEGSSPPITGPSMIGIINTDAASSPSIISSFSNTNSQCWQ